MKEQAVTTMPGYIALVHKDEGTSYGVSVPDVPGCISAGDTFEEAVANASRGARWTFRRHARRRRADSTVPRSFDELKRDP